MYLYKPMAGPSDCNLKTVPKKCDWGQTDIGKF